MKHYKDVRAAEKDLLDMLYCETYHKGRKLIEGMEKGKTDTAEFKHYEKQHDLLTALIETYRKGY